MNIQDIKAKLTSLKGEQRKAAIDAIKNILQNRMSSNTAGGDTGNTLPPEINIDPDLLVPTSGNKEENNDTQPDYTDPDDVLKKVKHHSSKKDGTSENNSEKSDKEKNIDKNEPANDPARKLTGANSESSPETPNQPQIGDQGDPNSDLRKAEDAYRKANEYKDEAEEKAEQAKASGNTEEAQKQQNIADKASDLADKASNLADGDELDSKEKGRLKRIQDALHNIEIENKIKAETEKAVLSSREEQKRKEQQKKSKEFNTRPGGLAAFKHSIDKFMKDQIAAKREASWKRPNKRYPAETGIVMRGKARVEKRNVPLLVVYFDQSGSWGKQDVKHGLAAIESLNYYVKQHKLKLEVYYFAINIHDNAEDARREGGTLAAQTLVEDIKRKRPNNVVIMTDSDPDRGKQECPSITVDGGVWLLFRNGNISKDLYKNVRGKMLTEVFEI